jgi:K(+)-stimulated pyrophosphate-energized sodium pump
LNILLKLMSVVALVIAPSIALDVDEVTAHNMESIKATEQIVLAENAEVLAVADETTMVIESTEVTKKEDASTEVSAEGEAKE